MELRLLTDPLSRRLQVAAAASRASVQVDYSIDIQRGLGDSAQSVAGRLASTSPGAMTALIETEVVVQGSQQLAYAMNITGLSTPTVNLGSDVDNVIPIGAEAQAFENITSGQSGTISLLVVVLGASGFFLACVNHLRKRGAKQKLEKVPQLKIMTPRDSPITEDLPEDCDIDFDQFLGSQSGPSQEVIELCFPMSDDKVNFHAFHPCWGESDNSAADDGTEDLEMRLDVGEVFSGFESPLSRERQSPQDRFSDAARRQ
jgi:hypothetical protein